MSRYFFHVYDGDNDTFDSDGCECEGIREMRIRMLEIAMQEVMSASPPKDTWSIEASNAQGVIVGSMDFGLSSSTDYRR